MTRVKRGKTATKKRTHILQRTKGFRGSSKSKERQAKERILHAYAHAYVGRKLKKRDFRKTWQVKINAAAREHGLTYGRFMNALKKAHIMLDRKMLAYLAQREPRAFAKLISLIAK